MLICHVLLLIDHMLPLIAHMQVFLGMALLLSSREERLRNAFTMLDLNESGGVSREEVEHFLRTVCPAGQSRQAVRTLAGMLISDADANDGGTVTFQVCSGCMLGPADDASLPWHWK